MRLHNMKEGPGGWWALLGDDVEKRVPKVDESMVVKGEKNVTHPTSANPAFLEIFECLLEIDVAHKSVRLGDSSVRAHHTSFLTRFEASCHQLEGSVNATDVLPTC